MTYTNNKDSDERDFKDGQFSGRGFFKLASSGNCYDGEWKGDKKKMKEACHE